MKGDFSRNTFNPKKHYRSVLKQQGRVDVDADWNEQQAINMRRIETEATDVIGGCGAPKHDAGFHVVTDLGQLKNPEENNLAGNTIPQGSPITIPLPAGDFLISAGRYYVDGILCENEQIVTYTTQPDLPAAQVMDQSGFYVVYLDVWQRHITALDDPSIREKALGGPDTATRLKTIWQVKVLPVQLAHDRTAPTCDTEFIAWDNLIAPSTGTLDAQTQPPDPTEQPCLLPPSAGYQRLENQLYRVEIHKVNADGTPASFVWSRDNGTVVTAIKSISGNNVVVADVGPDDVLGFANGQWVEIVDDTMELNGRPGQLFQISDVKESARTITLTPTLSAPSLPNFNDLRNPKLRRWDQTGDSATQDGVTVTFGWQPLEDGIEVVFSKIAADGKTPLTYKTGDYWLIPARTATGEIEWPPYDPNAATSARPPMGIEHHYCRLGLVQFTGKTLTIREDCRNIFPPLTEIGMVPVVPAVRAMHVQEKGINWENDGVMQFNQFLSLIGNGGLTVKLDANIDPNSFADSNSKAPLSLGNMIVTIEVPFNAAFKNTLNTSLIVEGVVTLHGTIIIWKPSNFSQLSKNLNSLLKQLEVKIIMVRVILRGFAIWSKLKEPRLYLDGQAFGTPIAPTAPDLLNRKSRIDLRFPSGLGVQASDFQSWFFLDLTGNG